MRPIDGNHKTGAKARVVGHRVQLVGLAAALVAFVASAGAAQAAAPATLNAGPVKVHGYQMSFSVSEAKTAGSLSLQVSMMRATHSSTQQHAYMFAVKPNALKIAKNLSSATLKTGELGGFGSITMKLVGVGKLTKMTSCGMQGQGRRGTLSGSLRLVLDKTYFRIVNMKKIPAWATRSSRSGNCGAGDVPTKPRAGSLSLIGSATDPTAATLLVTKGVTGPATIMSTKNELVGQARVTHFLTSSVPGSAFTAALDLSTAHIDGNAGAPLFAGALDFSSHAPAQSAGKCTMAFGPLSGSLVAHFDSIGDQSIGGNATITRC